MRRLVLVIALMLAAAVPARAESRDAVAVIIGNKTYQGGVPEVAYAHRDAEAMRRFALDVLGYDEANVINLRDATQAQMLSVFGNRDNHRGRAFQYVRPGESDLLVYFSGHGVPGTRDRRGYLLPVDADPATVEINGYPIDMLYENLAKIGARSVTIFIEACFSGDSPRGLLIEAASPVFVKAELPEGKGITVLTAASGAELASWDDEAGHGLFTHHLLEALHGTADAGRYGNGDGRVTLAEIKAYLDRELIYQARRRYNREQHPTIQGDDEVVLLTYSPDNPPRRAALPEVDDKKLMAVPLPPAPDPGTLKPIEAKYIALKNANVRLGPTVESRRTTTLSAGSEIYVAGVTADGEWYAVERDGSPFGYIYAPLLEELRAAEEVQETQVAVGAYPAAAPDAPVHDTFRDCELCPEMVVIPPGSFVMGSPASEEGRTEEEGPQRSVTIPMSIAVGKYEVTFAEWDACVLEGRCLHRPEDRGWGRGKRPVISVSWDDAKGYVAWLAQTTGKPYRLLTEAEWEYVARAGTSAARYWGDSGTNACGYANGADLSAKQHFGDWTTAYCDDGHVFTAPAGSFRPNGFGLHDVLGNAWEWVEDCWNANHAGAPGNGAARNSGDCSRRVLRGGSWSDDATLIRAAARKKMGMVYRLYYLGFRVARPVD